MVENTKQRPGEFDALEKARPDELMFTLLERDPCAPGAILHWVDKRRILARDEPDAEKRRERLRQCSEAEFIAFEMQDRQRGAATSAPEPTKEYYSGNTAAEPSPLDAIIAKLRATLGDADYFNHETITLMEQAAQIEGSPVVPAFIEIMKAAAVAIHGLALEMSPHRAALLAEAELPLES